MEITNSSKNILLHQPEKIETTQTTHRVVQFVTDTWESIVMAYRNWKGQGEKPVELRIEAFNQGDIHSNNEDRIDVYTNDTINMRTTLHDISSKHPFFSTSKYKDPVSLKIEIGSKGNEYEMTLPVIHLSSNIRIERITDTIFQITVKSLDKTQTFYRTKEIQQINKENR